MKEFVLILYTRKGCCLCEALEEKLGNISFDDLNYFIDLEVIDIDGREALVNDRDRFDLEVPVMLLRSYKTNQTFKLPRCSPRLEQEAFLKWFLGVLAKTLNH